MIRRGDNNVTDGLLDYLSGLFTHDIDRMDPYSNIKEDKDTSEEVKAMGGFGKALAEKERAEGRKEGRQEGEDKLAKLVNALISAGRSDEIAKATKDAASRATFYAEFNIS